MQAHALSGGFSHPAPQSAHAFRAVMEAMARPGTLQRIAGSVPPAPLCAAAGAVVLTLCDADTPIHLAGAADCQPVRDWIAFHTGAPLRGPADCMFALGRWQDLVPLGAYPVGTAEYPDRSATLIVELDGFGGTGTGTAAVLRGPGIQDTATLHLPDVPALQANHTLFPLGLDFIFASGDRIAALPRSTEVL